MKLLYSSAVSNGSLMFFIPSGQWGSFLVVYSGDAAAGVTMTRANCGNLELNWNGDPCVNVPAEVINKQNNHYGGYAKFASAVGGAYEITALLNCGAPFDNQNVYHIDAETDKVYIKLDFPYLAANSDSGFVKIYGKPKRGVQNYIYNLQSRNVVSSGAGTLSDTHPIKNIIAMHLLNTASVSNIQITKDNNTIVDGETDDVNYYSDWLHQLEVTDDMISLEFAESRDVREAIGGQVQYKYVFTGADTLQQYFGFITFTPNKAVKSKLEVQKVVTNLIRSTNQSDAIAVPQQLDKIAS